MEDFVRIKEGHSFTANSACNTLEQFTIDVFCGFGDGTLINEHGAELILEQLVPEEGCERIETNEANEKNEYCCESMQRSVKQHGQLNAASDSRWRCLLHANWRWRFPSLEIGAAAFVSVGAVAAGCVLFTSIGFASAGESSAFGCWWKWNRSSIHFWFLSSSSSS